MIARLVATLVPLLLALACGLPALASGGAEQAEHGVPASQIMWQAVNLILILGIIVYAARKPAANFFKERRARVSGDLEEAAELLREAEARYTSWQRKLIGLEAELEEIRAQGRSRADREGDRIITEARAAAERIKRDAAAAVDQELRRAKDQLHDEASELAVELAAKILRQQVQPGDRDRLLDEFITHVERIPAPAESGR
jgi:F-type H+-transporting ATPase subunit b